MTAVLFHGGLEARGRRLVEANGGKWDPGRGGMCRCPAHDDTDPSLSIRIGDTSLLFHCFAGCTAIDILYALRRQGERVQPLDAAIPPLDRAAATDLQPLAERVWRESRGLGRTLAASYLASRRLASHSAQLRFHPRVQLGRKADATFHPALIAAVRDDAGLVAVHRTFLDPAGGKARFENPKRLLACPGRGAVRIGQPGRVLGLAEGIETALAASAMLGIPVWAVLGNERFGMVAVPDHVDHLVLLGDDDAGGERAVGLGQDGHQRAGRRIEAIWPPDSFNDWCDALEA